MEIYLQTLLPYEILVPYLRSNLIIMDFAKAFDTGGYYTN